MELPLQLRKFLIQDLRMSFCKKFKMKLWCKVSSDIQILQSWWASSLKFLISILFLSMSNKVPYSTCFTWRRTHLASMWGKEWKLHEMQLKFSNICIILGLCIEILRVIIFLLMMEWLLKFVILAWLNLW